jgi:hypothetical protein
MSIPRNKIIPLHDLPSREDIIFVDHSMHSTFATCEEKARLSYVEHRRPKNIPPPLVFGSAFHAGVARLYIATSEGHGDPIGQAELAFIQEARQRGGASLPISGDSSERRSVERGLNLLRAYAQRWKKNDALWEDIKNPVDESYYIEIGFAVYLMDWKGRPVVYVGKIDRIRRNRVERNLWGWETKTTTSSVGAYTNQIRPNHQLTAYKWGASELLGFDLAGMILDVTFVSDRKIGGKFPDGIDIEKDFGRVETRRSRTDIEEFLYDLNLFVVDFLSRRDSGMRRWHRNAPAACFMYGGCHYRRACETNLNPAILNNDYIIERWEPWKGIVESASVQPTIESPSTLPATDVSPT